MHLKKPSETVKILDKCILINVGTARTIASGVYEHIPPYIRVGCATKAMTLG